MSIVLNAAQIMSGMMKKKESYFVPIVDWYWRKDIQSNLTPDYLGEDHGEMLMKMAEEKMMSLK